MPIIKISKIIDIKLGKSAAKEIQGTKIGSNEEWKKGFFANNKELRDKLDEFEAGDIVNVVMEQTEDKKYWNIKDFKEVTDDEIEKATDAAKKFSGGGAQRASGGADSYRRPDGGSRGSDTNRSASVYLAKDFVTLSGMTGTPEELVSKALFIANVFIYPYISDGSVIEKVSK